MKLKQKIIVAATVAIAISGSIIMLYSYYTAKMRLENSIQEQITTVSDSYNAYVKDWLRSKSLALGSLPDEIPSDTLLSHLVQLKNSAQLDNVFLAFDDGSQINANGVELPDDNNDPRKWGWYKNANEQQGSVFIDNPTVAAATGENVVSLGYAVDINGREAVLGADVEIKDILFQLRKIQLPGNGVMLLTTDDWDIFTHSNTDLLNQPVSSLDPQLSADLLTRLGEDGDVEKVMLQQGEMLVYSSKIQGSRFNTLTLINYDTVMTPIHQTLLYQLVITGGVIAACALLFYKLLTRLFLPLEHISEAMFDIAKGEGDLTARIPIKTDDEIGRLSGYMNEFIAGLHSMVKELRADTVKLKSISAEAQSASEQSRGHIEKQHHEISMISSAVTELSDSTDEIAQNSDRTANKVKDSNKVAEDAINLIQRNLKTVSTLSTEIHDTKSVINQLNAHATSIGDILATIQSIAEQTNLLALNASIEAARAGEHGRGFSVVADEVRELSKRTKVSTEEIHEKITVLRDITGQATLHMDKSYNSVNNAVDETQRVNEMVTAISTSVATINDMSAQIATAAEQQAVVTDNIMQNIVSVKAISDEVLDDAVKTSRSTHSLSQLTQDIEKEVSIFKI